MSESSAPVVAPTPAAESQTNPEASIDTAYLGAAGAASAESAEILNLLSSEESGAGCCGGSCCSI